MRPPASLLILSAPTEEGLRAETDALVARLAARPAPSLATVARELAAKPLRRYRRMAVGTTPADVCRAMQTAPIVLAPERAPRLVMLFPGEPMQPVHGARELYDHEPRFREEIDGAALALQARLGLDVRELLYGEAAPEPLLARGALFVLELALARLWLSWGVTPAATLGLGIGAQVAACLAGTSSLQDAAEAIAATGHPAYHFVAGVWALLADEDHVLLEVGPGWTLTALARKHLRAPGRTIVSSLGTRPWLALAGMLEALGTLALAGVPVSWAAVPGLDGPLDP